MVLTPQQAMTIRDHWKGRHDFLGQFDAQKDADAEPHWLDALYLRFPTTNAIIRGGARLVVGRKGAGKSAAMLAARRLGEGDSTYSLQASADNVFAQHIAERLRGAGAAASVALWHQAYALEFMKAFARDLSGSALTDQAEVVLRKWALEEGFVAADWGERVVAAARQLIPTIRKHLPAETRVKLSEQHISELLARRRAVLYIDDFDRLYSNGNRSLALAQVRSALEAADRLSSTTAPSVTLLLREDLWLSCRIDWDYLDKVSGLVDLRWSETELREFVERRLRLAAAKALGFAPVSMSNIPFSELWALFFPSTIALENNKESAGFGYILRRTLYTPRDLQTFLTRIASVTTCWPASQRNIEAAEETYSADRLTYMISEFSNLCRGLDVCLNSFAGKRMEFAPQDLFKHLKGLIGSGDVHLKERDLDPDSELALAKFLFRIGFLEVRYPDEDRFEVRDALRYPDHWRGIRRDDAIRWAIRSSFFRALRGHGDAGHGRSARAGKKGGRR